MHVYQYPILSNQLEDTVITANAAAAATEITVRSITGFAVDQYLLFGEWGAQDSEIVKTHATTAPSGTTITLVTGGVTYAHDAGTKVYRVEFNRVEISQASTAGGTKTVLTTTALEPDKHVLHYLDTSVTTGFYFARFNNQNAATFGSYSPACPYDGWATNTVGYMIEAALQENQRTFNEIVTPQWCYDKINECLKTIQGKQLRWPEHQNLNAIIGQTTRGIMSVALPSDIYDNDSNKSILAARLGDQDALLYKDPLEFEEIIGDVKTTTLRSAATVGATTLPLTNSYDFADSGSVNIYNAGTLYNITYTGVTRDTSSGATGALTGIPASGTGSITVAFANATNVWQDEEEGKPIYFTIRNGNFEAWPLSDATYDNFNIRLDYWTVATEVNSDDDTLDTDRFDMVQPYLSWTMRNQFKRNGEKDFTDPDYILFKEALNDAIRNKARGLVHRSKPKINRISY